MQEFIGDVGSEVMMSERVWFGEVREESDEVPGGVTEEAFDRET